MKQHNIFLPPPLSLQEKTVIIFLKNFKQPKDSWPSVIERTEAEENG